MANYHVENIERITEQMIEEEVLADITSIKTSAIQTITNTKNDANNFIAQKKTSVESTGANTKNSLNKTLTDTNTIYNNILKIPSNTEVKIENNVRTMAVDNGFEIKFSNDGNGNITGTIARVE